MGKIWKAIQNATFVLAAACMAVVIVLIFINVLCRYIFLYSIPWCEELTRYMFIAVIFLTLNIMVQQKAALRIDILDNVLGETGKFILGRISSILILFALGVLTASGIQLTLAGKLTMSPSLHLPMYVVYVLMPIGYGLTFIEVVRQEVAAIKEFVQKRKEVAQA